jgi:hypothetical protein
MDFQSALSTHDCDGVRDVNGKCCLHGIGAESGVRCQATDTVTKDAELGCIRITVSTMLAVPAGVVSNVSVSLPPGTPGGAVRES